MFQTKFSNQEKGQGLVEYALILVLVAIVTIVILALLGPAISGVFADVYDGLQPDDPYGKEWGSGVIYDGGFGDGARVHFCSTRPSGTDYKIWDLGSGWSVADGSDTTTDDWPGAESAWMYERTSGTCP